MIATGAEATIPSIEGTDLEGVYTLGSITDGRDLRGFVSRSRSEDTFMQPDRGPACQFLDTCTAPVGIVGGGYIGIEMAEALAENDFEVHLFQRSDRVLTSFSEATSEVVADHLRDQGVALRLDAEVKSVTGDDRVKAVVTTNEEVSVGMVLLGTGVRPRTALAEDAGAELGPTGAIATNDYGETSVPNVYAAGDCAEADHVVTGEPAYIPLALTANRHGRAIGQTVAGEPTEGGPIAGTAAVKTFEMEAARTGLVGDTEASEAGFEPVTRTVEARSRAGYYPEDGTVTVTLTADRSSSRLLGASLVSEYGEGAVHRGHAIVAALHEGATVSDVERYDLAYAPPFNTTWDPVLTAAKVLGGTL